MNEISPISDLVIKEDHNNRKKILHLQDEIQGLIKEGIATEAVCPLKHHFVKGMYARELFIPQGTLYVGKIHKFSHFRIISQGKVSIFTEEGETLMQAPCTMITPAGTKRVGYAHEDTVITTIHRTDETDLDKIEEEIIAKDYSELPFMNELLNLLEKQS